VGSVGTMGRRTRRTLLAGAGLAAVAGALAACAVPGRPGGQPGGPGSPGAGQEVVVSDRDRAVIRERLAWAEREGVGKLAPGEAATRLGATFLGTPYAAHTLEAPGPERLVITLEAFDCVTFVETVLVLTRLARRGEGAAPAGPGGGGLAGLVEGYATELRRLRYRRGTIDGYPSRLHYFSDWIADNTEKGLVRDVTQEIGGVRETRPVGYMSAHPADYPALADPAVLEAIRRSEVAITARPRFAVPAQAVKAAEPRLQNGDVIAVTTSVPGLDVTHTGLATWVAGRLHLLHAPAIGKTVEVSALPLAEWLPRVAGQDGIMVARPL
jgi:hypothetical protein